MIKRILFAVASLALASIASAQVFGPTTRTPQLTVSPGPTAVQDLTINGTCIGCATVETSGSFTVLFANGCTVDHSYGFSYRKVGPIVTLRWGNGAPNVCVGDSIAYDTNSLAPIPAAIRPITNVVRTQAIVVTDNSVSHMGYMQISPSGNIQMSRCIAQGAAATGNFACSFNLWTTANNRGFESGSITYNINQ